MTDSKVNVEKLITILDKLFVVPSDSEERLIVSGLTPRQAKAILLFSKGKNVLEITKIIADGSIFTQNAYDAIGAAISKIFESLIIVKEISENKEIISTILKEGLNFKRKFELEYR